MPSPHQSLLCQYHYDALDRLIGHAPANEAQHQRFYCKSRLATEIQGVLRHSIVQNGKLLLAQQQRSGNTLDTTLLATDQQRSVLHVVSKADQQQQSIVYSPYGHRSAENGLLSLLGFNGERRDPVTGHYLLGNGYRAFNPVLMRFNSPDSLSPFEKGGLNPYAYCLGDPINRADPNGHYSWGELWKALTSGIVEFPNPNMIDHPTTAYINNGFNPRTALLARDRIVANDIIIKSGPRQQNMKFAEDYAHRFDDPLRLQDVAHNATLKNNISLVDEVPQIKFRPSSVLETPTDRSRTLEFLRVENNDKSATARLSHAHLISTYDNTNLPNQIRNPNIINNYIKEINDMARQDLITESNTLIRQHFTFP